MNQLLEIYRDYLTCLNHQAWNNLVNFIYALEQYIDIEIGLLGYRSMLEENFRDIPDLYFTAEL